MYNDLFSVGPLTVHGYGLMIGIGVVVALWLSWARAEKRGQDPQTATVLAIFALVFGFAGAKILYVLTSWEEFTAAPLSTLGGEGFVVYGGILAGLLACWLYCRRRGHSFLVWVDIMLPPVALAQGFGRLGCFLAGCCYGSPTNSLLGVVFPVGSFAPSGVKLWPTQLFSAGGDFLLAAALLWYDRREHPAGRTGLWYMLLYAVGRFAVEFFRDDPRGSIGIFSTSQFIALLVVAAVAVVFILQGRRSVPGDE